MAGGGSRDRYQFWRKSFLGSCLCLLAGLWFFLPPAMARAQTVRVGYDPAGAYLYKDAEGEFQGYNLEYLYEIAKYTDWQYEFVAYSRWAEAIQALENGEIDVLPTVLRSPEREGRMLFPMRAMSSVHVALVVAQDDTQYFYGDIASLMGKRIGVRRDTVDTQAFEAWAAERGLTYEPVPFSSQEALLAALDRGEIEAAAMSYVGHVRDYRAVAEFSPKLMYFAIAPGRGDLLQQMNIAMEQIAVLNPGFFERIVQEYMKRTITTQPVFSHEERALLEQAVPVRVALLRRGFPFSAVTDKNEFQGIVPDLLRRITELSGMQFTFVPVDSQQEALKLTEAGEVDMIGRVGVDLIFAKKEGMRLTSPYVMQSMVRLMRKGTQTVQRVALLGMFQKERLERGRALDDDVLFEACGDTQEAFTALVEGRVDALYVDSATAAYFLNTHRASEYQINSLPDYYYDLAFGVSEKADKRVALILDKCIRFISTDEMNGLISQHRQPGTQSLTSIIEQLPLKYLLVFLALVTAAALLLGYASFSLWRKRGIEQRMADIKEKNRQIQVDLQTAQQVNAIREDFFSCISHDMRTPLNGITGFTRLAAEAATLAEARAYIEKIKLSNALLVDLVEDTLQLSKFERGNFRLTLGTFRIREFVTGLVEPIRLLAEEKKLRFVLDTAGLEDRCIIADQLNTRKIIQNLLSNAVKFTPAGGEAGMVISSCISPQGRFVLWLKVYDTGIGISREFLPRIYDPFAQERQAGKTEFAGNGLGLTIVRRLVDIMGGELTITSTPGKGTEANAELYFELAPGEAKPVGLVGAPDYSSLGGKRVLLCEDNELNAEIAGELLAEHNIAVIRAENGQQGLELFRASAPGSIDAVLMDIRMPVMDGYAATKAIRAMDRVDAKTVPILALSADAFAEDIARCLAIGMNAHIAKPIDPEKLFQALLQWCGTKKN